MAARPGRTSGLPNSERIAKIVVSPTSSDTVFAAVPGALWSDSPDRGLYKTTDGGKTWNIVLKGANLSTGASAIALDPTDPNKMFAALWDFRRKGWTFRSGGDGPDAPSGSGLFRTADGGATWTEITPENAKGFPKKPYGRIAVAIAPSNAKRVYAFVESTDSALFVSDDGGATWDKRDKSNWMVWRPFYFANLIVDPKNPDRVFKTDGALILSEDAGKSFTVVGGFQGAHGDLHDVWIDPTNPQTVVAGDDGGMWYSYNGGSKWWKGDNLPVSQFYHVSVDDNDPYPGLRRFAGQQFLGRPIAISRRHHQRAVGEHVRRRRFLDVFRSGGSRLSLCRGSGWIHRPGKSPHAPGPRHSAEAKLQGKAALELEHTDRLIS